jgi:cell division protein FtsB
MDKDYFTQIAQALLKQKQRMDQLEAENRELRQYLYDLRTGRGIFVEIAGKRFPLRDGSSPRAP